MQFKGEGTLLQREITKNAVQRKGDLITQRNKNMQFKGMETLLYREKKLKMRFKGKGTLLERGTTKNAVQKRRDLYYTNVYFSFWSENWNKVGTNIL